MKTRIGQLTDIHVAEFSDMRLGDWFGKRATGWVNYTAKRADEYDRRVLESAVFKLVREAPDLVVISGDLTNLGLPSELREALRLLQPFRDAGIRTVVIPGNHDYYVRSAARGAFEQICAEWQVADARLDEPYPFVVRERGVSVVCFNSAVPTPPLMAYGMVDDAQIARGRKLAKAEMATGRSIVFAVHHHPTRAPHKTDERPRGLRNVSAFRRLAAYVDAKVIMHGHNHFQHFRRMRGAPETCICGVSSGITSRQEPAERVGQAAIYEFDDGEFLRVGVASWRAKSGLFSDWVYTTPDAMVEETQHESLGAGAKQVLAP